MLFGLLVCGAAPLFVGTGAPCEAGCYSARPGTLWLGGLGDGVIGVYWLIALVLGTALTSLWYVWFAQDSGLRTRVRSPALVWTLGTVLLMVGATVAAWTWVLLWPALVRQDAALLVVAAGLLVLARLERSRYLLVVTLVVAGSAVLGTYYNPENLLFRVLHLFGVADAAMPFRLASALGVLLPGVVLLAAGVVALAIDARRR